MNSIERDDAAEVLEMIGAAWMTQVVFAATELGIADALDDQPKLLIDLAVATGCDAKSLLRLMRALVGLGLCVESDGGHFSLSRRGYVLRADSSNSVRSWALWWGGNLWPLWGLLARSIKTGESARHFLAGFSGYQHLAEDTEAAKVFHQAMTELTRLVASEVLRVFDFKAFRRVADIGGGHGELLFTILAGHVHLKGMLVDLPQAIPGAEKRAIQAGVAERCELCAGDFFVAVPAGADLYLLKSILHNWNDDRCRQILQNCRAAMASTATLLLVERMMPDRMDRDAGTRAVARSDLNMLVGLGGRERTQTEFAALLASAGFITRRLIQTELDFVLIEAVLDPRNGVNS